MRRTARIAAIATAPVLVLGLGACGSSSDSSTSASAEPTAPVTPTNVTAGNEQFCDALAQFENANSADLDAGDGNDSQTAAFAQQLAQFNADNASTMPEDVKPAFQTLEQDLQGILANNDPQSGTDAATAVRQAAQVISSLRTIGDWTKTNCGFDF